MACKLRPIKLHLIKVLATADKCLVTNGNGYLATAIPSVVWTLNTLKCLRRGVICQESNERQH